MYAYKAEVSVLPNGIAISGSDYFPGATYDIDAMRAMVRTHNRNLKKSTEERDIADFGPHLERQANS